jgi:hypothetical protein
MVTKRAAGKGTVRIVAILREDAVAEPGSGVIVYISRRRR